MPPVPPPSPEAAPLVLPPPLGPGRLYSRSFDGLGLQVSRKWVCVCACVRVYVLSCLCDGCAWVGCHCTCTVSLSIVVSACPCLLAGWCSDSLFTHTETYDINLLSLHCHRLHTHNTPSQLCQSPITAPPLNPQAAMSKWSAALSKKKAQHDPCMPAGYKPPPPPATAAATASTTAAATASSSGAANSSNGSNSIIIIGSSSNGPLSLQLAGSGDWAACKAGVAQLVLPKKTCPHKPPTRCGLAGSFLPTVEGKLGGGGCCVFRGRGEGWLCVLFVVLFVVAGRQLWKKRRVACID